MKRNQSRGMGEEGGEEYQELQRKYKNIENDRKTYNEEI